MLLKTPYVTKTPINLKVSECVLYENLNYLKLDQNREEYKIKRDNKDFKYFNILYLNNAYIDISYKKTNGEIIRINSSWGNTTKLNDDIEEINIEFYEEIIDIKGKQFNNITENLLQYYEMNFPFTTTQLTSNNIIIKTNESNSSFNIFSSTLELTEHRYDYYNYEYYYSGEGTTTLEFKNMNSFCITSFIQF